MVRMVYYNGACYLVGRHMTPQLWGIASRMIGIHQGTAPGQGRKIVRYYA